jgi:hypothetical protein
MNISRIQSSRMISGLFVSSDSFGATGATPQRVNLRRHQRRPDSPWQRNEQRSPGSRRPAEARPESSFTNHHKRTWRPSARPMAGRELRLDAAQLGDQVRMLIGLHCIKRSERLKYIYYSQGVVKSRYLCPEKSCVSRYLRTTSRGHPHSTRMSSTGER